MHSLIVWSVTLLSLGLTVLVWYFVQSYAYSRSLDRFIDRVDETNDSIADRIAHYEQVLRSAVGLFEAHDPVSREQWKSYIEASKIQDNFPGIQGVGVAEFVDPDKKQEFVDEIRAEGFSEFDIHPAGVRERYSAIIYLEPFDWRNQRAFGYDMYSDATRRAAMDSAIESGEPTFSGHVVLVQETEQDVQLGFLVYMPVYKKGASLATREERHKATKCFVYAVFRVGDLMAGILSSNLPDLDFEIFDGPDLSPESLLYDSNGEIHEGTDSSRSIFREVRKLDLEGRSWTLFFESQPGFNGTTESLMSSLILIGGFAICGLTFFLMNTMAKERQHAMQLAEGMTEAFKRSEKQFREVCENAHEPILLVDGDGKVLYVNPAVELVLGYRFDELVGNPIGEIFDLSKAQMSGRKVVIECLRKSGELVLVRSSVSQWEVGDEQFIAINLRDVTEEEKQARQIQQAMEDLRRSNRELDDFAYIASHDLQTPLRGIENLSLWAIEDAEGKLPAQSEHHLNRLRSCVKKMGNLLADLLAYSRAGRLEEKVSVIDLRQLVDDIIESLSPPGPFRIEVECTVPSIQSVRVPLETCLRNLIANSIKHHDRDDGQVSISIEDHERFIRFSVRDDGPGIKQDFHERIFKIFQTLGKADPQSSSGVGLAIVEKIVSSYGGRIELESKEGAGSNFVLYWPRNIETKN